MRVHETTPGSTQATPGIVAGGLDTRHGRRSFRIFLLEDNASNAIVIESYLDELDMPPPVVVGTIAEAREHSADIIDGSYDLVICDLMLPDGQSVGFISDLMVGGVTRIALYSALTRPPVHKGSADLSGLTKLTKPLEFRTFRNVIQTLSEDAT